MRRRSARRHRRRLTGLRYEGAEAAGTTRWVHEVREWGELDGRPVPLVTAVRWGHERTAWAVLRTEAVLGNADLSMYVRTAGP